jgi:hypothetical protein
MLSKFVCSLAVKQSALNGMRFAPRMMNKTNQMIAVTRRGFVDQLGLESTSTSVVGSTDKGADRAGEVSLWKDRVKEQDHALVLKDKDEVEKYVVSVVKNYFRTTKKAKVGVDSVFADHGLDSLDVIELVI